MSSSILSQITFRQVSPTDIPACWEIEKASYPADEAASKSSLQYRQHHAAPYFRCAVLMDEEDDEEEEIVGYICATRCREFTSQSMLIHDTSGPLLAIHSVVVATKYRHQGIATKMMKDYIKAMQELQDGVTKIVLLAKSNLLGFYVKCGFSVVAPSKTVHGQDLWFDCELILEKDETGYPCWILDSFASKPGSGNPAAIVVLPEGTDFEKEETVAWMEIVAQEFNLAETAFIWPKQQQEQDSADASDGEANVSDDDVKKETSSSNGRQVAASYYIRYFTCNGTQVDLCGHATLASAAVLFQTLPFKSKSDAAVVFEANKDLLKVTPYKANNNNDGNAISVKMNFPRKSLTEITDAKERSAVLSMLTSPFRVPNLAEQVLFLGIDEDANDLLVELTRDAFLSIGYEHLNYRALLEWDGYSRGVILCCREEPPDVEDGEQLDHQSSSGEEDEVVDFLSRFFGPKAGINEDPVTGSAHCTLAPYFAQKLGKTTLVGRQVSQRQGVVKCIVEEDRVSIIGTAITTVRGSLFL